MRIFLSVLIIVLCIMIIFRLIALFINSSGKLNVGEKILQIVGCIFAVMIGVMALLYMLGVVDDISIFLGIFCFVIIPLIIGIFILVVILLFLTAPFILIAFGIKKKKKAPIIIASAIWGPIYIVWLSCAILFPQERPYIDMWIKGKTVEEIVSVYGEPIYNDGDIICYCENNREFKCFMGLVWEFQYYCIEFDENGKACNMYMDTYDETWLIGKTLAEAEERFGYSQYTDDWFLVPATGDYTYYYVVDHDYETEIITDVHIYDSIP